MKVFGLELKAWKQEVTSVSINNIEKDIFLKVNKMVFVLQKSKAKSKKIFIYDGNRVYLNVVRKNIKDIKCLMVPEI